MSDEMPKLHLVGGKNDEPVAEEEEQKVPTVATQALKIIHPMFQDEQGNPMPPPPDHEFRVGFQLSIAGKQRVVQEAPGTFFVSGDDIEEIAEAVRDIALQALQAIKAHNSPVKVAGPNALEELERLGETH